MDTDSKKIVSFGKDWFLTHFIFNQTKKMVKRLLLLLLLIPVASAISYYADISISVDTAGFVTVEGQTNHPTLLIKDSQIYTSKKDSYWLLNITIKEFFSDYVYEVNLPKEASINYIKSSGSFRIENNNGAIVINGYGEDKPLSILVQYQLVKNVTPDNKVAVIVVLVLAAAAVILFLFNKYKRIPKRKETKVSMHGLTARQNQIVKLILEQKKPITQMQIEKTLKLPKASVSRNIHSLELKGIIEKEKVGMSNMIKLRST